MAVAMRKRAVLFADLVGSTRLYDKLGDREAHVIAAGCVLGIRQAVERFGGVVVKTIGDEVMATFLAAEAAFGCAEAIVAGMRSMALGGEKTVGVHVGFAFGPVIEEKGDVFGDTVNVAARMVELAENQRVFTTSETAAELDDAMRCRLRHVDSVAIKGREQSVEVFELMTGHETLIRLESVPRAEVNSIDDTSLVISCRGKRRVIRGSRSAVTIGRDKSNDLVLNSPSASRFHARIEWRKHGFYIVDRSSNGTKVVTESGRVTTLRKEGLRIVGSGSLGIGGALGGNPEEPIVFELKGKRSASRANSTRGW